MAGDNRFEWKVRAMPSCHEKPRRTQQNITARPQTIRGLIFFFWSAAV